MTLSVAVVGAVNCLIILYSLLLPVFVLFPASSDDIERGGGRRSKSPQSPPQTVIIPVYRRDCHEEVYAGSHAYPGTGVYLLKFDNSYSLWRSKTLYYRVYYTQ